MHRISKKKLTFLFTVATVIQSPSYAMDFESLKSLIQSKNIGSIEELLPQLPESLRSKYALVFNSRSLQGATYLEPRALLYNEGATFMISFNGSASQKGFDALETLDFNSRTREFYFHEIQFHPDAKLKSKVTFTEANPDKCLKCHGSPTRPIWDTYPLWPGAYGEKYHAPLSPPEQKGIKDFLSQQPHHPRYKYLINTELFSHPETFNPSHENRYNGQQKESPNEELSRLLGLLNTKRIVSLILNTLKKNEGLTAYQSVLLTSLSLDCENIEYSIPESSRAVFLEKLKAFSTRSDERNADQEKLKQTRSVSFNFKADSHSNSEVLALNSFRFLIENGLGLSTDSWTTALESGTYDFAVPQTVSTHLESQLLSEFSTTDPELSHLAKLSRVSSPEKYCAHLRKKSLSELDALLQKPSFTQSETSHLNSTPELVKKCLECHGGSVGPDLPFDQPNQMAKLLHKDKYPRGTLYNEIIYRLSPTSGVDHMPLGQNLSDDERQNLEHYFKTLKDLK